jgi:hypothetical protein
MNRLLYGQLITCLFVVSGLVLGGVIGANRAPKPQPKILYAPLPHHVSPHPKGVSFRFSMVHDIIHERYPKHGPAFYEERERLARLRLAKIHPESKEALDLMDDIAAGLARRGKPEAAVKLLEEKLAIQRRIDLPETEMYTTYANLGTFMVDVHLRKLQDGDTEARKKVVEGRELIAKAMKVNPNAHFGREIWQRNLIDFYLDAQVKPKLLEQFDFLGNRLDNSNTEQFKNGVPWNIRPYNHIWVEIVSDSHRPSKLLTLEQLEEQRDIVRRSITEVGGADVAFDEPMLGIIGMWRAGGGANPHFALCMGETMLRVGQRFLAWNCYERASRLAEQFWPKPELQDFLKQHCKQRQQVIEETLSKKDVVELRPQFERELAYGQKYQKEYQEYVAKKIAAGVSIDVPDFYDEFNQAHKSIATKPGKEEWYATEGQTNYFPIERAKNILFYGWFGGGLGLFWAGCLWAMVRNRSWMPTNEVNPQNDSDN